MSFNVGENVGPYRIIEQLGQGGMATVFKAYHASLDRYVAIKVLHPAFGEDPSFTARFQREARVVAKLEHPNIVPIYDYAEHEKRPYLVMKFIEGMTLKAKLDQGPLTSREILKIADAVGSALAYAHRHNILHRDIKPSNVLFANDGQIYLADFGLARIAQLGESTLSGDMIIGTPQYISPEQAMGVKDLDERTDLYSFGVMLYEMVVGKVPFNADTPFSIIHDHIYSPLPLPHKVNPDVSGEVERVLLKALAKDRLDRYESVEEMISAFQEAWQQSSIPTQSDAVNRATGTQTVPSAPEPRPDLAPTKVETAPVASTSELKLEVNATAAPVKRKRSRWVWIGVGLLLLCCLGFTIQAIRGGGPAGDRSFSLPKVLMVKAAQDQAQENPKDPELQLELALAYWNANMSEEAYTTLDNLIKLVGPENAPFYEEAGNDFLDIQAWTPSAILYLQAVKFHAASGKVPAELLTSFHEAVYKSAERKETSQVLSFDEIANVDEAMALIARARYAHYTKDSDQAYVLLEQVKKLRPDMHEATLLEAEFDSLDGKPERATILLLGLMELEDIPEWIQIYAGEVIMERLH